jgi:hypothetical protein
MVQISIWRKPRLGEEIAQTVVPFFEFLEIPITSYEGGRLFHPSKVTAMATFILEF